MCEHKLTRNDPYFNQCPKIKSLRILKRGYYLGTPKMTKKNVLNYMGQSSMSTPPNGRLILFGDIS